MLHIAVIVYLINYSLLTSMYQDYTAIAILLLTAIPVLAVAATVFFYVKNNDRKTPLTREDFYR